MISVGIVGASGYTGEELIKSLSSHPDVQLTSLTSNTYEGKNVKDVLSNNTELDCIFKKPSVENLSGCDVVFFATPNGVAMKMAQALVDRNIRVIDISADYRFQDVSTWEHWYGQKHASPSLVSQSVYGLPELPGQKEKIAKAKIVGNPGCYPTAALLSLMPICEKLPSQQIIIDAKSGISGAGRNLDSEKLFPEGRDNFQAYAVRNHRHYPEILSILNSENSSLDVLFVPHLSSMIRGIYSSIYLKTNFTNLDEVKKIYIDYYKDSSFVDIINDDLFPKISDVANTNRCKISVKFLGDSNGEFNLIVFAVIDNLVKGASGQAIQNMNLMFGLDEKTGLI